MYGTEETTETTEATEVGSGGRKAAVESQWDRKGEGAGRVEAIEQETGLNLIK